MARDARGGRALPARRYATSARLGARGARRARDPAVAGGAFALRFAERSFGLAIVEWGARLRARWAGLPYGDQALFARRAALEACGGVPPVAIAEDLDLVRALRRAGRSHCCARRS
jgi:hypothetical protein